MLVLFLYIAKNVINRWKDMDKFFPHSYTDKNCSLRILIIGVIVFIFIVIEVEKFQ